VHGAQERKWGQGSQHVTIDLAGKRVLVTGASSGIGARVAVHAARAGAVVGMCARRAERLRETLDECREHSPDSQMWVIDLGDLDLLPALATAIGDGLGPLDVLVNNAGAPRRKRMDVVTLDAIDDTFRVNFTQAVRLTQLFLPAMIERGTGHVVNVSSMGTRSAALGVGTYCAAKAALNLATEAFHLETAGTGVDVQLFIPGTTRTEFSLPKPGNEPPMTLPASSYMEPDDVATALWEFVGSGAFEGFASEQFARISAAKLADTNGFLASTIARITAK
jgi:short-subunit dehydrogenase